MDQAYTSLTGLYFVNAGAPVKSAFTAILGPMTVGARIGKAADRDQQLAGDDWFYYGGLRRISRRDQAGGLGRLPAGDGRSHARPFEAYFTMAEYSGSVADYQYALELNPTRADVHDRLAVMAAKQGRAADAVREWRLALAAFSQMMDRSASHRNSGGPQRHPASHRRSEAASRAARRRREILRTYIRRNGFIPDRKAFWKATVHRYR